MKELVFALLFLTITNVQAYVKVSSEIKDDNVIVHTQWDYQDAADLQKLLVPNVKNLEFQKGSIVSFGCKDKDNCEISVMLDESEFRDCAKPDVEKIFIVAPNSGEDAKNLFQIFQKQHQVPSTEYTVTNYSRREINPEGFRGDGNNPVMVCTADAAGSANCRFMMWAPRKLVCL